MILSDATIIDLVDKYGMIAPFTARQVRRLTGHANPVVSYGLSSYGYDVVLARDVKVFTSARGNVVNPKEFDEQSLVAMPQRHDHFGEYVILPPGSYMLGHTVETFDIPEDVMVIAVGKSTYARSGVIVNVTPIEPGFRGQVVIEISNASPLPVRIYLGEGIAQFLFLRGDKPCSVSYDDRGGKYQNQAGIVPPRI